ncbi:hypothetical protein [Cellulophaga sp. BC115SP]|uniref:hypothetical protein n=1 Tax=Cellulophaga sp. BC115SP TaxID=2683263 RepID=UPI0014126215|nr:hypothetical protein [Cellulophaga sp. BC115SP]NBB27788.1 hypothetical protein [Cellulophaga sp. BC115SP]
MKKFLIPLLILSIVSLILFCHFFVGIYPTLDQFQLFYGSIITVTGIYHLYNLRTILKSINSFSDFNWDYFSYSLSISIFQIVCSYSVSIWSLLGLFSLSAAYRLWKVGKKTLS